MALSRNEKYEIAGLALAAAGLLYAIYHKQKIVVDQPVGASIPTLLGSGGDSGGTGLSPIYGDDGATISPMTLPAYDPPAPGSIYAPSSIQTFLGSLANPNGMGCCGQSASNAYSGVPPAYVPDPPNVTMVDIEAAYPNALTGSDGARSIHPAYWVDYLADTAGDLIDRLNQN